MVGWLPRTRILLLLLYRPEYTHQWASKSYYARSCGAAQHRHQCRISRGPSWKAMWLPELRELILSRAAGNPLFMEELTYSLLDNGSIQKKEDRIILTQEVSLISRSRTPSRGSSPPASIAWRKASRGSCRWPRLSVGSLLFASWRPSGDERRAQVPDGQSAGAGIHLREKPFPRAGVHLPARPGPGGGLQQPADHSAEGDP